MARRRVIVVGGGLSGLTAALAFADRGARVHVLEAGDRWGGQIRTTREADWIVEEGAEAFAARGTATQRLLERLGLVNAVTPQREVPSLVLLNGRLDLLQAGEAAAMLGIRSSGAEAAGLVTMTEGMETLIHRLVVTLDAVASLHLASSVRRLHPAGATWTVETDRHKLDADALVLAAPPGAAAALLEPIVRDSARTIARLPARSSLTVSLAYSRDAVSHPLDATGFVVPPETPTAGGLTACTFASTKFPGRASRDGVLLRVFYRPDPGAMEHVPDADWVERAHAVLVPILGIGISPSRAWVSRWPRALPDHGPGYGAAVAAAEDALSLLPGLTLCGAGYHGPGVDGAVRSGAGALDRLPP